MTDLSALSSIPLVATQGIATKRSNTHNQLQRKDVSFQCGQCLFSYVYIILVCA